MTLQLVRRYAPPLLRNGVSLLGGVLVTLGILVGVAHLSRRVEPKKKEKKRKRTLIPVVKKKRPPPRRVRRRRDRGRARPAGPAVDLPALKLPSSIPAPPPAVPQVSRGQLLRSTFRGEKRLRPTEELVLTEEMVDKAPQPLRKLPPRYPLAAQERGVEGEVVLKVLVAKDGSVKRVLVDRAKPAGVFERAARATVRKWRFSPATFRGKPVTVWVSQTISFTLH